VSLRRGRPSLDRFGAKAPRSSRRGLTLEELEGAYRRDRAAFERIAVAIVGDKQVGYDAVQRAFVQALRHRDRFRHNTPVEASLWRYVIGEARKRRAHMERSRRAVAATGPRDPSVTRTLEELIAADPQPARWESVVDAADTANRRRWRWLVRAVSAFALVIVIAVVALAWPFGHGRDRTVIERAAGTIGDRPVLHFVVRGGWGGALIDLKSGDRRYIHATEEFWYEPDRGIHEVSRFAGVAQTDAIYAPARISTFDDTLASLITRYRRALRDGSALIVGRDVVEGQAVYWIRVDSELRPDAGSKLHTFTHDVAVSRQSFEPVAVREMRDGKPEADRNAIVLMAESVSEDPHDFIRVSGDMNSVPMKTVRGRSLTPSEASAVLGRPALWAGPTIAGLGLAGIRKDERSEGYDPKSGRWAKTYTGATFSYGSGNSANSPYLQVHESRTLDLGFQRVVMHYSPPEGSILVFDSGIAVMRRDGLYLALEASNEGLLLAAARGLERAPGS
jgi:DNA-directed RNA polymerase specialized sigma24 family protein